MGKRDLFSDGVGHADGGAQRGSVAARGIVHGRESLIGSVSLAVQLDGATERRIVRHALAQHAEPCAIHLLDKGRGLGTVTQLDATTGGDRLSIVGRDDGAETL